MSLYIKEIIEENIWEEFLLKQEEKTFLQSWGWGEFQKKERNKIWRWGIYNEENNLIGISLIIKIRAKKGSFLFVPHGPIISPSDLDFFTEEILKKAKEEKVIFIRIAPVWDREKDSFFKKLEYKEAPIHVHPEVTWELNIGSSEGDILSSMRKTTRYLIRQAQKNNDIEIIKSKNQKDLEIFNEIYRQTAKRHRFVPFSLNYLYNEFLSFNRKDEALIFIGKYKGKPVSSAIIIYHGGTGFYHQGASLSEYNRVPVSYLIQWEAIKEAAKRGCKKYNFWGIAPDIHEKSDIKKSKHPWAGLSLFKMGFGGERKDYVKTQDMPCSFLYAITYIIEKIRKKKRGL